MGVFIWTFDIISHLGSNSSFTITNNFRKFQVMILFSWMSWMSTMTKMTFISISDMHIVSFVKKYNLPIRRFWIHTTSNICTLSLTKRMTWHLTFLCPTKPWRMFFESWMQLWKMNMHFDPLLFFLKRWNLWQNNQWLTDKLH
jgi:hypothetical protein